MNCGPHRRKKIDSTEPVASTDKETVKDNGLEEATESGSTDSSGGEGRLIAPRS